MNLLYVTLSLHHGGFVALINDKNRLGLLKRKSCHASLVGYLPSTVKRYTSIVGDSNQSTILRVARSTRTAFSGYAAKQN